MGEWCYNDTLVNKRFIDLTKKLIFIFLDKENIPKVPRDMKLHHTFFILIQDWPCAFDLLCITCPCFLHTMLLHMYSFPDPLITTLIFRFRLQLRFEMIIKLHYTYFIRKCFIYLFFMLEETFPEHPVTIPYSWVGIPFFAPFFATQKKFHYAKKVQVRSFFWSVFSRIWTKYRDLLNLVTLCSVSGWKCTEIKQYLNRKFGLKFTFSLHSVMKIMTTSLSFHHFVSLLYMKIWNQKVSMMKTELKYTRIKGHNTLHKGAGRTIARVHKSDECRQGM